MPIDTKPAVWVAYIKMQLGIATQVSVIKLMLLLLKIEIQFPLNSFSLLWLIDTKLGACNQCNQNLLLFALAYWHQTCCMGSLHQDAALDCYPGVCDQGQGHCY